MKITIMDIHETDAYYPHIKQLIGQTGTFYVVKELQNGYYQGYFYAGSKIYINNILKPRIYFDAVNFSIVEK